MITYAPYDWKFQQLCTQTESMIIVANLPEVLPCEILGKRIFSIATVSMNASCLYQNC